MIPLTLQQVAQVTAGALHGIDEAAAADLLIDGGVVTDSREATAGSLYVARIGEHADGHDFVGGARERGAVAALTSRPVEDLPCVVVPDVQAGFVAIADAVVRLATGATDPLTVIGITGSSGKTSTKDLLGQVLSTAGPTIAPVGSYNSEVGVPLTICRVTPSTRFLVVEMGARGAGHIDYLCAMAHPRIGAVLNVGFAHVGEFGTIEDTARAKSELLRNLPEHGAAIINLDDALVAAMRPVTSARVVTTSAQGRPADVSAQDIVLDAAARASFTLTTAQGSAPVHLGLVGAHHVANALTVAAIALECGLAVADIAAALSAATLVSGGRMQVTDRADGIRVVNDAYNANPDSMRAALSALRSMAGGRRTWAVLGSMLELGPQSEAQHRELGAEAARHGVDRLLVVGEVAQPIVDGARAAGLTHVRYVPDRDAAAEVLHDELAAGDVVLLKSSNAAGLRLLADTLSHEESQ